jgi:hypothetical protein
VKTYFVGLDLGRRQDFTAMAVVERTSRGLRVRHVERMALGTEYVEIVSRVRRVMESPALAGRRHLTVDATGLGGPVVELLRRAGLECRLWAVSITGGRVGRAGRGLYRVPKRELVVGLQVLFEQGEIQIAEGLEYREDLVRELSGMRVKVRRSGRARYEAGGRREHDDLVSALSLACWGEKTARRGG